MLAKNERRPGSYTVFDLLHFVGNMDQAVHRVADFLPMLHKQIQYEEVLSIFQEAVNQPKNPDSYKIVQVCGDLLAMLWPDRADNVSTQIQDFVSKSRAAEKGKLDLAPFLRDEMASEKEAVMLVFANLLSLLFKEPMEISDGKIAVKGKITDLPKKHALHDQAAGLNVFSEPREVVQLQNGQKNQPKKRRVKNEGVEIDSEVAKLISEYILRHIETTITQIQVVPRARIMMVLTRNSSGAGFVQNYLQSNGESYTIDDLPGSDQQKYNRNASFWNLGVVIDALNRAYQLGHLDVNTLRSYGSQA